MTKREAIRLLTEQKQIFESHKYSDRDIWRLKTGSLIEHFLGLESNEYYSFSKFDFGVWHLSSEDIDFKAEFKRKHELMVGLLDNCIDKLKIVGLYKKPQRNILSNYDNWKLITIAVIIFVAGLTAGIWLKENTSLIIFSSVNNSSNNHADNKSSVD